MLTFTTREMDFNVSTKVLSVAYQGQFPDTIMIISHNTGRVVTFTVDGEAAIRNEGWDGEMMEYVAWVPGEAPNVKKVVLHH